MALKITDINHLIGVASPWVVSEIEQDTSKLWAKIHVTLPDDEKLRCPHCGKECPGYDHRKRTWRHTAICDYSTKVVANVPRVNCLEHGVSTISVPWADPQVQFTTSFEARVIDALQDSTSISAVAERMGVSWTMIAHIMDRAVKRGKAREKEQTVEHICVDEIASKKGHNYVTIVSDPTKGRVLHVAQGRTIESLKSYYTTCSSEQLKGFKSVNMDMWPAYISATLACVQGADKKIAFDHFHVTKYVTGGVDTVRKQELRAMRKNGILDLVGTKYIWISNASNLSKKQKEQLKGLKDSALKTARAWAMKEMNRSLWNYKSRTWALKAWKRWLGWLDRSQLDPMKKVSKTIKKHLWGIINAIVLGVSNGPAESINSRIKAIKVRARGFRNQQRFANAIYFYLGGLDLYPVGYQKNG
ncbi:MAG: ISL3 family transposase [Bacteroidetes bacterium]|nr:ISL3 family transposase [Bacteroidota bacterium]